MRDPWRRRCPQGHTALQMRSEWYYCLSCDAYYKGEPYDAKRDDLPIDEEPMPESARGQVSVLGMVLAYWVLALFLVGGLALGVIL